MNLNQVNSMGSRRHFLASIACLFLSGCAESAPTTLQGLYGAPPPANVKVVHYYGEAAGMDPSFAWVLSPIDNAYLKQMIKAKGLKAPAAGQRPSSARYGFPSWWNHDRIEALPEVYFDDSQGLRRIWVDRENDRLYIEFVGT